LKIIAYLDSYDSGWDWQAAVITISLKTNFHQSDNYHWPWSILCHVSSVCGEKQIKNMNTPSCFEKHVLSFQSDSVLITRNVKCTYNRSKFSATSPRCSLVKGNSPQHQFHYCCTKGCSHLFRPSLANFSVVVQLSELQPAFSFVRLPDWIVPVNGLFIQQIILRRWYGYFRFYSWVI
jgi:hypothetical protein